MVADMPATPRGAPPARDTWTKILASAYVLFADLEARGFGSPPFTMGGGTVLMLRFEHRLSQDIDLFGYDAQWLSLLSPRLNAAAAALATSYTEAANAIKIVTADGDIDFIVAADVTASVERSELDLFGRLMRLDSTAEILAKKLFYRAASLKARDVYDLSAAIDLDRVAATTAVRAAVSKKDLVFRSLMALRSIDREALLQGIIPYDGDLPHADDMLSKVAKFVADVSTDGAAS